MYRKILNFIKSQPRWRLIVAAVALAGGVAWLARGGKAIGEMATFAARRGPLQISVLEGGTMQAVNSQEIKCEVRVGYQGAKILKIVDEGYQVTDDDVRTNKILIELDSSELQKQAVQQEIVFQTANAALADAKQGYDIQKIQNTSDILAAEQKARFARMDFEKFLGNTVADKLIEKLGVEDDIETTPEDLMSASGLEAAAAKTGASGTNHVPGSNSRLDVPDLSFATNSTSTAVEASEAFTEVHRASSIDFSVYTNLSLLGDGEAKQKLRKFQDDLQVAQKELGQAQSTLEGTRRLSDKGFVTQNDLKRDEIAYENSNLKVKTAETARDLFLNYEFLKTAEENLSKYCEAMRELERARKSAIAKLAQADARLKSATAQYNVQYRQRRDLDEQIAKCLLKAERPGLVIYGRAGDDMVFYGGEERIREGASVRERQTILTIPDMSKMGVKVKIHETYIKKIKAGQQVRITVDAFPDKILDGEVTKVAVLPDSQNRWMNPDMKVYLTTIAVNGTNDWLKPGMSTKVEILVDRLDDVVYVPIQAVVPESGKFVCYLANGSSGDKREVEVGQFNDEFIEVSKGISAGDLVLLHPPRSTSAAAEEKEVKSGPTNAPAVPRPNQGQAAANTGTNGTRKAGPSSGTKS